MKPRAVPQSPPSVLPRLSPEAQTEIVYAPELENSEGSLMSDLDGFNAIINAETVKAEIKITVKALREQIHDVEKLIKQCEKVFISLQKLDDNYNFIYCELRDLGDI